ncbi:hypothetical protein SAMN05216559_1281 [Halomicrobium zhouii]|uniref:Uncharacterized protein n=1 Tax=Halomicrobium zhouii TaxID=767519 RepID=A0A1I6KQ74_9EURY|nr:hypothetical protein [Halomicrobium zhouii]SFR93366.1 hypothetical protein SAMN05216559_1281 [Halomicrobium zhouii]
MTRPASAILVAGLCVLTGCGGFVGQPDADVADTVTPAPVPTVPTDTPQPSSDGGIDADSVAADHWRALDGRSHTARTSVRWRYPNGSTYDDTTVHRVGPDRERFHAVADYGRPRGAINRTGHELWYDGERSFYRVDSRDAGPVFRQIETEVAIQYPGASLIRGLFARLRPVDVRQTALGSTVVTGPVSGVYGLQGLSQFRDERNVTMAAHITPDGYVGRIAIGFDAIVRDRPVEAQLTIAFTDVGSTRVTEPAWVENVSGQSGTSTPVVGRPLGT